MIIVVVVIIILIGCLGQLIWRSFCIALVWMTRNSISTWCWYWYQCYSTECKHWIQRNIIDWFIDRNWLSVRCSQSARKWRKEINWKTKQNKTNKKISVNNRREYRWRKSRERRLCNRMHVRSALATLWWPLAKSVLSLLTDEYAPFLPFSMGLT